MPFHSHQQPHLLALFIAQYSAGVTNENAYKDQADDINKCCGLDGVCGESERKRSFGRGVERAQLLGPT